MNVEHEVKLLVEEIKRLGSPNADGQVSVKFGVLFSDDRCANIFEGNKVSEKFLNITLFPPESLFTKCSVLKCLELPPNWTVAK